MMKYNYAEIGERIRTERKNSKMAQEKLIERMQEKENGIGRNMLSNAENGDFGKMTLMQFLTICDILGCDAGYLLGECHEHSYDLNFICEETNLTEKAAKALCQLQEPCSIGFLDAILETDTAMLELVSKKFYQYMYASNVIKPSVENSKEQLADKKIIFDFVVNGEKAPSVPVQDLCDYARFELLHAFVDFINKSIREG